MSDTKYVYFFGNGQSDGGTSMRNSLGGKGANLAEMTNIGLPVPAGFTISTDVCTYYYDHGKTYPPELKEQVEDGLKKIEKAMGAKFGSSTNPLLLSCRSGARESMPGMMDTVLNIGLNDDDGEGPDQAVGQRALRLGQLPPLHSDVRRRRAGTEAARRRPTRTTSRTFSNRNSRERRRRARQGSVRRAHSRTSWRSSRQSSRKQPGVDFPTDPMEQVWGCIGAVFGSWMNDRAMVYRRQYGIPHDWGTATNVQAMVFGNLGDDCATGVGLTRNCSVGDARLLRRLPHQRPGRRRRGRHPHAQADRGDAPEGHARSLRAARRTSARRSNSTTRTCRTSSSPCSAARSGCCRPATPSEPVSPPCGSRSIWSTKA